MKPLRLTVLHSNARATLSRRTPRERVLLLALAVVILCYGTGTWILRPMLTLREDALLSIGRSEAFLARLALAPEASGAPPADGRPVSVIVTETAPQYQLTIRRIEPDGQGARLVLGDADYARIITWLDALTRDHGLRIAAIEMDRRPEPGLVSTSLTLEQGKG